MLDLIIKIKVAEFLIGFILPLGIAAVLGIVLLVLKAIQKVIK